MTKQRLYVYDNVKLLLIIFVVIGHLVDYGGKLYTDSNTCYRAMVYIYAFHMPLFIFIAGLFYKARNTTSKIFYYLSVGLTMKVLIYVAQQKLYHTGAFTFSNLNGPDWFMLALAVYAAAMPLLQKIDSRLVLAMSLLLGLFSGYADEINTFLSLSRIIVFFPFFVAGTMVDGEKLARVLHRLPLRILGGALILAWTVIVAKFGDTIWFFKFLFTGSTPFSSLPEDFVKYGCVMRGFTYVLSGLLCLSLIAVIPDKKLGFLSVCGSRTIQVYFWHLPCVLAVHTVDYAFFDSSLAREPWGYITGILIAVLLALVLSLKPFSIPTAVMQKLTTQKQP